VYIGGDNLTSKALNMLSMQVFVMREGIPNFVSIGNKQFMDSKIAIRCPMSVSSRHFSTKLIKYLVFCVIVITMLLYGCDRLKNV
jgi:hypothetical protein